MELDHTQETNSPASTSTNNNNNNLNDINPTSATTNNNNNNNNSNNCTMTTATALKSNYDIDVVRLIGQHLINMGLKQTVNLLLEESGLHGLDHPLATRFQQHILAGEWDKATSLVEELMNLVMTTKQQQQQQQQQQQRPPVSMQTNTGLTSAQTTCFVNGDNSGPTSSTNHLELEKARCVNEMRLAIAEQKFLELIEDHQHIKALKCLRLEITPLCGDDIKSVQHLATLLMCRSTEEVRLKANWPGKGQQSRQMLVEKLQRYIPPLILLPPKRLTTLLNQAIQLQEERCPLHIKQEDDYNNEIDHTGSMATTSAAINGDANNRIDFNSTTTTSENTMQQTNGHNISSSLASLASSSSSILNNNVSNVNCTRYFDLKQDHVCSADRFPLMSRQELDNHKTEVWYCKFSNDGTKLATGGLGGKVKIWQVDPDNRKLKEKCTLDCNSYSITCLSWSPNDVYLLACGSEDKPDLWIWNINKEELHNMISHSDDESTTTCSWHLSGEKFAAASIKGNFNIYDLDGNRRGTREGVRVQCLSFLHKDPDYILAADTLNRIKSYAIKDMSLETEEDDILEERNSIMSFTIDRDDKYIAVNLMEQGINLWDFRLKTLLRTFPGVCQRNLTIYSSFSSPRATFLASGSEDGKVYIYHVHKDLPVAILHGHTRCVNCVSWNPRYPELLVSVSDDRIIRLWAPSESPIVPEQIK
jgi:WD40 repeat protein